jgi:hypothetical protein
MLSPRHSAPLLRRMLHTGERLLSPAKRLLKVITLKAPEHVQRFQLAHHTGQRQRAAALVPDLLRLFPRHSHAPTVPDQGATP